MIFTRVVSDELFARAGAKKLRHAWHRPGALPAVGLPFDHRRRRVATAVSALLHALLVWVLLQPQPLTNLNPDLQIITQGGGGPGPAGGGGGGTRGTGGVKYVRVAPPPTAVTPPVVAPIVPPVEKLVEPPKPVLPEPVVPKVEMPKVATPDPKAEVKAESPVVGAGGGTGNDGTRGNGPGTGGGVGSGIGTGRGSGVGPGTGGGAGANYIPTLIEMPIPPQPVPSKVKGAKVIVNFDIDERGKIVKVEFTPTRDGGYNRKLDELFKTFRFRAAVTPEGVPIAGKYQVVIDL